jgi:hypothetical protein
MLILWSSWKLLRDSVDVLLEATPRGIDATGVRRAMVQIDGVAGVHDLHIWTVTSGLISLSAHVEVTGQRPRHDLLNELTGLLRERFGIAHVTLQAEEPTEAIDARGACSIDTEAGGVSRGLDHLGPRGWPSPYACALTTPTATAVSRLGVSSPSASPVVGSGTAVRDRRRRSAELRCSPDAAD